MARRAFDCVSSLLVTVTILAACTGPTEVSVPSKSNVGAGAGLRLAADGLRPNGTALRIDFGRAEDGVVTAVSRLTGKQPVQIAPCRNGNGHARRWADGLTLFFIGFGFSGWEATRGKGASPETSGGLAIGQPAGVAVDPGITSDVVNGQIVRLSAGQSCSL